MRVRKKGRAVREEGRPTIANNEHGTPHRSRQDAFRSKPSNSNDCVIVASVGSVWNWPRIIRISIERERERGRERQQDRDKHSETETNTYTAERERVYSEERLSRRQRPYDGNVAQNLPKLPNFGHPGRNEHARCNYIINSVDSPSRCDVAPPLIRLTRETSVLR